MQLLENGTWTKWLIFRRQYLQIWYYCNDSHYVWFPGVWLTIDQHDQAMTKQNKWQSQIWSEFDKDSLVNISTFWTHWPLKIWSNFTSVFLNWFYKLISWALPMKLLLAEHHRTPFMRSIASGNAFEPDGIKSLPESMLTKISAAICRH